MGNQEMVMDKYFVKSVGTLINSSFPQGMENSIVFGLLHSEISPFSANKGGV